MCEVCATRKCVKFQVEEYRQAEDRHHWSVLFFFERFIFSATSSTFITRLCVDRSPECVIESCRIVPAASVAEKKLNPLLVEKCVFWVKVLVYNWFIEIAKLRENIR